MPRDKCPPPETLDAWHYRAARGAIPLTQKVLAREAQVSEPVLERLERGGDRDSRVRPNNMLAVRHALARHGVRFVPTPGGVSILLVETDAAR
jgi:hypothetical protein